MNAPGGKWAAIFVMARYTDTLESPRSVPDVFAYLSDFSTTREWDPGVEEAERLDPGPVRRGSRFRVAARFLGRRAELVYEITEYREGEIVTLRGENVSVISLDTMTFSETPGGGARVTYDARLGLKGPLRVLDPLLGLAFKRVGDRAAAGLRQRLGAG